MRSNGRLRAIFSSTILLVLLLPLMATGCGDSSSSDGSTSTGGTSSNAAAGDASATSTSSLPPDVVVVVNGKQFTTADLEKAKALIISDANYYIQAGNMTDESGAVVTKLPSAAEIEEEAVGRLVWGEVDALEAQIQGISVSQAELDAEIATQQNATGYPPHTSDQIKADLLSMKMAELRQASMPPNINPETDMQAFSDYLIKAYDDLMKKYDIVYADQYKPKTTTSTTATSTSP